MLSGKLILKVLVLPDGSLQACISDHH